MKEKKGAKAQRHKVKKLSEPLICMMHMIKDDEKRIPL